MLSAKIAFCKYVPSVSLYLTHCSPLARLLKLPLALLLHGGAKSAMNGGNKSRHRQGHKLTSAMSLPLGDEGGGGDASGATDHAAHRTARLIRSFWMRELGNPLG
jgi:hypothetical protein